MVASEAFPLIKTGGLADVVGALPCALAEHGVSARVLLPAYRGVAERTDSDGDPVPIGDLLGAGPASLVPFRAGELRGWLLQCDPLFDREAGPYLDVQGHDWPDNHLRFGSLCRAAALMAIVPGLTGFAVDVVHAHDWQAGLVGAYFAALGGPRPPVVFTAHNLHFSGRFDPAVMPSLALPWWQYHVDGLEFWGAMSFLKAGVYWADRITTVSPTYAQEIQTEMGGEGMHGLLSTRAADLRGILNGIDDQAWNPRTDPLLAERYDAASLEIGKAACKADLQQRLGLVADGAIPLVGMVGRLTGQKGVDLLLSATGSLLAAGAQLAVLGSGDPWLEASLRTVAGQNPGRVAFVHGYDEALSHRLVAGSDLLVVPSRFEPCGLTQMYAHRYGTLPVVRATGGLADTVVDLDAAPEEGTGFCFGPPEPTALADALGRALGTYRDRPRFVQAQRRAMALDRGWGRAATPYVELYRELADLAADGSLTV